MTEVSINSPDAPEPSEPAAAGSARSASARPGRRRPLLVAAALLLPLIAFTALVVFAFQPFANAAGGCGGG